MNDTEILTYFKMVLMNTYGDRDLTQDEVAKLLLEVIKAGDSENEQ